MKKFLIGSIALAMSFFIAFPLFAQFNDGSGNQIQAGHHRAEGFQGEYGRTATVAEALKMWDDEYVMLVGSIVRKIRPEKYQFQDKTGSITVDIDHKLWYGLSVSPSDTVEIIGKIDKDFFSIEVDVKQIRKINN